MSMLSRRTLLQAAAGVSLATALGAREQVPRRIFDALPAETASHLSTSSATLRERWVDLITGRLEVDPADTRFAAALGFLDSRVTEWSALLDPSASSASVFTDLVLTGANPDAAGVRIAQKIRVSFTRLYDLALAWATPGSTAYGASATLAAVTSGVLKLRAAGFSPSTTMAAADNWWDWQIGAPRAYANILAILGPELTATELAAGCAAIDHFVPDPWYLDPLKGLPVKESTGANRVDLCQLVIVRSLVDGDTTRLEHARAGLAPVWSLVLEGDGFYDDGSMIQHATVPYTGSYGLELLNAAARLFVLLELDTAGAEYAAFFDLITTSYLPIVVRGCVMDSVRGRAIARPTQRSRDAGYTAIEGLLRLSERMAEPLRSTVRGRCRSWLEADPAGRAFTTANVPRAGMMADLLDSATPSAPEPVGVSLFGSMDRCIVHDGAQSLAIAASSPRITWYECSTTENIRGYHTGSGMTYFYGADDAHYDDEYWPTVDLTRLAGTTVDQTPLPDRIGGTSGKGLPQGEWTGGSVALAASADAATVFAQDLRGPNDLNGPGGTFRGTDLRARKAWFVHHGVTVALGAGIQSSSGSLVETTIDNRNLHETGTNALRVNGVRRIDTLPSSRTETSTDPMWAHIEGVGGYYLPAGGSLKMKREARTGAWSDVNTSPGIDSTPIVRRYLTLWLWHGQNFSGRSYQYAVLPGRSLAETESFAADPSFHVLDNTATCQAVEFEDAAVRMFVFWQAASSGGVGVSAPATVIVMERPDGDVVLTADQHAAFSGALQVQIDGYTTFTAQQSSGGSVVATAGGIRLTLAAGARRATSVLSF